MPVVIPKKDSMCKCVCVVKLIPPIFDFQQGPHNQGIKMPPSAYQLRNSNRTGVFDGQNNVEHWDMH